MSKWDGFEEIVAIADSGSFVAAARRLGASTSHVSRAVARLEAKVGARLFDRTTRTVTLTPVGRAFVEQGRRLVEERDEALQYLTRQGEMQGEIRITCSIAMGERFVAPVVTEFLERHPGITATVELTNRVVDLIAEGFDIGIRTGHPADNRLAARQIASRSSDLCAAPAYVARKGAPARWQDLEAHDCLIGTNATWHFVENGRRLTFVPTGRLHCNSGAAVVEAAVAGMGVCQLPAFYVRDHIAAGRLVTLLDRYRDAPEPVWAVYPQRRQLVPKVKGMIDLLEDRLGRVIP